MSRAGTTIVLAVVALLCAVGEAHARREQAFAYPFLRVWEAAVRLVRVDFASPISERNREDGYFLFEFAHEGEQHPGSVEIIRHGDEVRVVIQVPAMPSYVEQMLLDRLDRKLRADYGEPSARPRDEPGGEKKPAEGTKKAERGPDDAAPAKPDASKSPKSSS